MSVAISDMWKASSTRQRFSIQLKKKPSCETNSQRRERMREGEESQLQPFRRAGCCTRWYQNIRPATSCNCVINGPFRLHWSRRCRRIISDLTVHHWIIARVNKSRWNTGSLQSYPVLWKASSHLPSQPLSGRSKQIYSDQWQLTPHKLCLVFLWGLLQLVWLFKPQTWKIRGISLFWERYPAGGTCEKLDAAVHSHLEEKLQTSSAVIFMMDFLCQWPCVLICSITDPAQCFTLESQQLTDKKSTRGSHKHSWHRWG